MSIDILRRTGGWCVELRVPLVGHAGQIDAIEIRKATADVMIRWGRREFPSMLALLAHLCNQPESLLRQLDADDFDRVMFAFINVVPSTIKSEMQGGDSPIPMATPDDQLPAESQIPVPDQQDPRFPAVSGPVVRFGKPPSPPTPLEEEPPSMNLAPRPATEAVRG